MGVPANSGTRFGDLIHKRRNGADGAFFVPVANVPASMAGVWGSLRAGRLPLMPVRQPCTSATLVAMAWVAHQGGEIWQSTQIPRLPSSRQIV